MPIPGFTATGSLYRASRRYRTAFSGGRATGVQAAARSVAIRPAAANDTGLQARDGHFCRGVCWCCDMYLDYECCYACAVCQIAQSESG
jgi:hypothetical protein